MKKITALILSLIFSVYLCGCTGNTANDKRIIAVSIVPQATFAQKVCGDEFEIITMIPPGASAETYEPTIPEIAKLDDASIYFAIGVPAEQNIILPSVDDKDKIIHLHTECEKVYPAVTIDGERDPHLWLSPKRVIVMVNSIAEAVSKADPDNADKYKENAKKYCDELQKLDSEISLIFKDKQNRKFLVFHPAFGYFAEDYSLSMSALEEHGKEADAKHLSQMADLAKSQGIKTVFYQGEISGRQAEAFAEEINGKAVRLDPLSPDYTENMRALANAISEAMK